MVVYLVLDLGNTHLHAGWFNQKGICLKREHYPPILLKNSKAWAFLFRPPPDSVILSSVVPARDRSLQFLCRKQGIPLYQLKRDFEVPLKINVDSPERVGADRLANAYAAYRLSNAPLRHARSLLCHSRGRRSAVAESGNPVHSHKEDKSKRWKIKSTGGKAVVVVSFGTAITMDYVTSEGTFLGGMILPGFDTALHGLQNRCTLLENVWPQETPSLVGKNTSEAIFNGLVQVPLLGIQAMINLWQKRYGEAEIFVTGGALEKGMFRNSKQRKQGSVGKGQDGRLGKPAPLWIPASAGMTPEEKGILKKQAGENCPGPSSLPFLRTSFPFLQHPVPDLVLWGLFWAYRDTLSSKIPNQGVRRKEEIRALLT